MMRKTQRRPSYSAVDTGVVRRFDGVPPPGWLELEKPRGWFIRRDVLLAATLARVADDRFFEGRGRGARKVVAALKAASALLRRESERTRAVRKSPGMSPGVEAHGRQEYAAFCDELAGVLERAVAEAETRFVFPRGKTKPKSPHGPAAALLFATGRSYQQVEVDIGLDDPRDSTRKKGEAARNLVRGAYAENSEFKPRRRRR